MTGAVVTVAENVPAACHVKRCSKDGCQVDLKETPPVRLVVDMDCNELNQPTGGRRCDYLFVGEGHDTVWVAPIELKSGSVKASVVLEQLEGGLEAADSWLPSGIRFLLIPVLAHGKKIHREDLKVLRSRSVRLRGQRKKAELIKCGDSLAKALGV